MSANSVFISVAWNAYCFRKWNCYLTATFVRPRETTKSVCLCLNYCSQYCDIQFEKFHSIEKLINSWSKFISMKVIYCLTLNKFKWSNGGSVGIVTKLLARQSEVWSPAGERVSSTMSRDPVVHPNSYSVGTGSSFLGGEERIGREAGQPLSFVSCRGQETMELFLQSPLLSLWRTQGELCL